METYKIKSKKEGVALIIRSPVKHQNWLKPWLQIRYDLESRAEAEALVRQYYPGAIEEPTLAVV